MHRKQSRFPWSPGGAARRDRLHAAAKAKENQGARTDICQNSDKSSIDTKKELAKIAGVSHDTIARVEKIVQKAPEEVLVPKTRPHIMPYPADLLSPGLLTPPANGRA
jgi:hypothetical protein